MRPPSDLEPVAFDAIAGFGEDDLDAAFPVFRRSAERILDAAPEQRPACPPPPELIAAARAALEGPESGAAFFRRWFEPFRLAKKGFVTAYYEPEVEVRRAPEPGFETPALARPSDLVTLNDAPLSPASGEALTSARRLRDGSLIPYPPRREIEEEGAATGSVPLAYVADPVELFLIQVQGSARLRFPDGTTLALTYDGRNGWPYTSVGRLMIERGLMPEGAMSLEGLKAALRDMGVGPGQPGRRLMQENRSYVFFRIDESNDRALGPIGGEGAALTPLRSIAVDRSIWCYGLPFWIAADVPWESEAPTHFARLMIAQDTGSAILGAARADLFFGSGARAGALAGRVRHEADFHVFLPKKDPSP
ncbi:MltA domain-containing protein [Methylocystis sp. JR02]|uniref:murein transglycosylase A n=1 Tax=Methylocystis sp. JR02 TaxID=3046284 RepID=UPI0024BB6E95|nr:MltA domain-containing protein [Methylocystis sp. JR02]MDJ0449800.1 MltA domain-containing protein [Methylocystis sp. JR02]